MVIVFTDLARAKMVLVAPRCLGQWRIGVLLAVQAQHELFSKDSLELEHFFLRHRLPIFDPVRFMWLCAMTNSKNNSLVSTRAITILRR
jgi:hypothetical protein